MFDKSTRSKQVCKLLLLLTVEVDIYICLCPYGQT